MRASDRLIVAVSVAVFLASFTLTPLTVDSSFLVMSWLLIALLAVVSFGLRRVRMGAGVVFGVQVLLLIAFLTVFATGLTSAARSWTGHYLALWLSGIDHMQTQAAPMEPNDGITMIFVTVVGAIWVMTDLLVSGLARPMWGLAPPLTLFLVPAIGLGTDTGFVSFLLIAVGYLGILIAQGLNSTARWTRGLSRDSGGGGSHSVSTSGNTVVWRSAGLIGGPALAATLVLGLALPTLALPGFGFGNGPGGGGRLQLTDPTLDLRRNLNQPSDTVVIQYRTNQPGGTYLRMASLPELSSAGWRNVPMQLANGTTLPAIPGLSGEPGQRRSTTIRVLDFRSEYLPLPYAPRSFQAPGDWAHDPNSLVVLAGAGRGRTNAIRNLTYSVESVDIAPDATDLSTAVAGTPVDDGITNALPPDFPQSIRELTTRVAGEDTPIRQAAKIQAFLRGNEFTYSTEPLPGSGFRALENFLIRDKRGYCEQFAAAMAAMARVLKIPSRVAVGFLPGEQRGETFEVSIRDMHAWPELYFAGYGWVRFEPTPSSVTGTAPSWTIPSRDNPTENPTDTPSDLPSAADPSATDAPSAAPSEHTDRRRRRHRLRLGPDPDRDRHRPAGAGHPGGARDHPGPPPQHPAQRRGRCGRPGRVGLGRDPGHGGGSRRLLAGRVAARNRHRGRRTSRPARVGEHGSDRDTGRTIPVRPLGRVEPNRHRPADHDHRDPARHRRSALGVAPGAGRRVPPLGLPAPLLALHLPP